MDARVCCIEKKKWNTAKLTVRLSSCHEGRGEGLVPTKLLYCFGLLFWSLYTPGCNRRLSVQV